MQSHAYMAEQHKRILPILTALVDPSKKDFIIANYYLQMLGKGVIDECNEYYENITSQIKSINASMQKLMAETPVAPQADKTLDAKLNARIVAASQSVRTAQVAALQKQLDELEQHEPEAKKYAEETWGPDFDVRCPDFRNRLRKVIAREIAHDLKAVAKPAGFSVAQAGTHFGHAKQAATIGGNPNPAPAQQVRLKA